MSDGEEGRRGAAREGSGAGGRLGIRAAQARRTGSGRAVRRSGRQGARVQLVQGLAARHHVHLHEVSDAGLLPADGPPVRGDSADAQDGSRAAEGAPAQRQLRPGDRHPGRAEGTRGRAEGRSRAVDLPDRRSRRRSISSRPGSASRSAGRSTDPVDITHNLRTAIVDAEGRLVKVYTGNEWKPEEVVADLKAVAR